MNALESMVVQHYSSDPRSDSFGQNDLTPCDLIGSIPKARGISA